MTDELKNNFSDENISPDVAEDMAEEGVSEKENADIVAENDVQEEAAREKEAAERFEIDVTAAENSIPDYVSSSRPVYDFELENNRKFFNRPRKRGGGFLSGIIYLAVVFALAVGLSVFVLSVINDITGLDKEDAQIQVVIPQGSTLTDIAAILKEGGLIDSEIGFLAFAKLTDEGSNYQPGTFTLNPRMGYEEMLKALSKLQNIRETVKVTVVEGKTIEEIGAQLEEAGVCSAQEFIKALDEKDYTADYSFLSTVANTESRIHKLEGYIFPDTYNFYKNSTTDEVIEKFLDNFDVRFNEALRAEAQNMGMTVDQVLTLASIVQKEATNETTMKMVAKVFLNRLDNADKYPYLQSNSTLGYAIGEPIFWMTEEQMNDPNIYNTYVHKGLPPSAICNPGLAAIKAVLYPDDNDYYYFVTDENRVFYFSKTSSQHEKQVAAIKRDGVGIGEGVS